MTWVFEIVGLVSGGFQFRLEGGNEFILEICYDNIIIQQRSRFMGVRCVLQDTYPLSPYILIATITVYCCHIYIAMINVVLPYLYSHDNGSIAIFV